MRPMPFWPSFEPCAKLTPVQVRMSNPRIQNGGGAVPSGATYSSRFGIEHLRDQEQQGRADESDERRQQQRLADVDGLRPVDAARAGLRRHHLVGDPDADDRADQRVRARRRQAEVPGAEIPDDRRRSAARRPSRNPAALPTCRISSTGSSETMPNATAPLETQDADEVPDARPDDGDVRIQRVRVDHRRHGVGGVVEAVDELEAERDQQRQLPTGGTERSRRFAPARDRR